MHLHYKNSSLKEKADHIEMQNKDSSATELEMLP